MLARLRSPLLIAALVVAVGCGRPGPAPVAGPAAVSPGPTETVKIETEHLAATPEPEVTESLDPGRQLYVSNCLRCHGEKGLGDGPKAASLYQLPANLQKHVPHHSDAELGKVIRSGPGPMPAFKDLSEDDLKALLTYLRTLAPEH